MEKSSKKGVFAFDTSALISLAIIGLIDKLSVFVEIVVTPSVIAELEKFARFDDKYGKASKDVLKCKKNFAVVSAGIKETIRFIEKTDNELYNAAKQDSLVIITDDIKFSRHVKDKAETRFSTYFIIALVLSGKVSKGKALELLDLLREDRNWRNNMIYSVTKKELEQIEV